MASSSVLLYNCNGPEWTKLRNTMMLLRFRLRVISPEQYALRVDELAFGEGDIALTPYEGVGFEEPIIVLCNIGQAQLKPIWEVIRRLDLPVQPLVAMMTPTNRSWNSFDLYTALCIERESMKKDKK